MRLLCKVAIRLRRNSFKENSSCSCLGNVNSAQPVKFTSNLSFLMNICFPNVWIMKTPKTCTLIFSHLEPSMSLHVYFCRRKNEQRFRKPHPDLNTPAGLFLITFRSRIEKSVGCTNHFLLKRIALWPDRNQIFSPESNRKESFIQLIFFLAD